MSVYKACARGTCSLADELPGPSSLSRVGTLFLIGSPRCMDVSVLLRPEWVSRVARDVDAFRTLFGSDSRDTGCVDRFLTSLPPAECAVERQILSDLRQRLTLVHATVSGTPAERARRLLNDDYRQRWTLADSSARRVGCNRTTLQEEFHDLTGTTVHRFLVRRRVSVAAQLLDAAAVKVSCVSLEVGYQSYSEISGTSSGSPARPRPRITRRDRPAQLRFATEFLSNQHHSFLEAVPPL